MQPVQEKLSKQGVKFEHPAQGRNHCADCLHFQVLAPKRCEIVAGRILPQDWCDRFQGKDK